MSNPIHRDAHAVLLPAVDSLHLSEPIERFLTSGGCSVLLGVTRQEYVATTMSDERRGAETRDAFRAFVSRASALTGQSIIIAVDHELGGTNRLHELVRPLPSQGDLLALSSEAVREIAGATASDARSLGVNCFLSPTLDVVTGPTPWLQGRTWSQDPTLVGTISAAFVSGVQAAGVAATAKHFPGHHKITRDPAIHDNARMTDKREAFEPGFGPFREAIASGVEMVMVGPAFIDAFDADQPACLSPKLYQLLRQEFGFGGVLLCDDLDSATILKTRSLPQAAVDALNAGADYLILHGGEPITEVIAGIGAAVADGTLAEARLHDAANKVRRLAGKYSNRGRVPSARLGG